MADNLTLNPDAKVPIGVAEFIVDNGLVLIARWSGGNNDMTEVWTAPDHTGIMVTQFMTGKYMGHAAYLEEEISWLQVVSSLARHARQTEAGHTPIVPTSMLKSVFEAIPNHAEGLTPDTFITKETS